MPIIYQHTINAHTKLAVWHITEPESFFLARVPLKKEVSHPHKRLQHLAGRYLLPVLFPDFPLEAIRVADTRRPFLENEQYHFSISHCGNHAAAIVSAGQRVGVDIEAITPRIERVRHKFVTAEEWAFLEPSFVKASAGEAGLLTMLWSAKEALFKWYGSGQLDFRTDMRLNGAPFLGADGFTGLPFFFNRGEHNLLTPEALFMADRLVLSWIATPVAGPV